MTDDIQKTKLDLGHDFELHDLVRGRIIHLHDGTVFGRIEGNEIFSEDALLSKRHLKITIKGLSVFVEDLGSTNKTRINGKHILPNTLVALELGSTLEFGKQRFQLRKCGTLTQNPLLNLPHSAPSIQESRGSIPVLQNSQFSPKRTLSYREARIQFLNPLNWSTITKTIFLIFVGLGCLAFVQLDTKIPHYGGYISPSYLGSTHSNMKQCEEGYLPFSALTLKIYAFLSMVLGGLFAASFYTNYESGQITRVTSEKIAQFICVLMGLVFAFISRYPLEERKTINKLTLACACPQSIKNLPSQICSIWLKYNLWQEPESPLSISFEVKDKGEYRFNLLPQAAQDRIRANLSAHPTSKLALEERQRFYQAYDTARRNLFFAENYEGALLELKLIHKIAPDGIFDTKLWETAALAHRNPAMTPTPVNTENQQPPSQSLPSGAPTSPPNTIQPTNQNH